LVRGALAEMRAMLFELRPAALEVANFETLLGQLGDALHGRTRIPVLIECDELPELPPPVKVVLYRIAQEAVNNIIKHAGATQTQIELKEKSGQVLLRVWDNGCGFDPTKTLNGGLGLEIMRERAESIGAHLEIDSQPNQSTQVTVLWQGLSQNNREV
jgi:signal transduction histidine kinase